MCKACNYTRKRAWALANPDKVAASLARNAARMAQRELNRKATRKGLDPEEVAAYRDGHSGLCDICNQPCPSGRALAIDHCHATGAFRGLLCGNCNRGLGYFADSTGRLESAIAYLSLALIHD